MNDFLHLRTAIAATAILACADGIAAAGQRPHPAVARITAEDRVGLSHGSGALVSVNGEHGLVVTNWHVVRDAVGPITVNFPGGFRSAAKVMKVDKDWDLAALAIWKPEGIEPIPMSPRAPRRGEALTIAGWGSGSYREATGRCTNYVSPAGNFPAEMIELSTAARNGDSGGPILNARGELAGVLFGSGWGTTNGSYCGRVRWFLASIEPQFRHLPSGRQDAMIADSRKPNKPEKPKPIAAIEAVAECPGEARQVIRDLPSEIDPIPPLPQQGQATDPAVTAAMPDGAAPAAPQIIATGPTRADQIKTILAGIGVLFLLFHAMRLLGELQQTPAKK